MTRLLEWKTYMVLARRTLLAIDRAEPATLDELTFSSRMGPAKVERLGRELLETVREGHSQCRQGLLGPEPAGSRLARGRRASR